MNQAKLRVRVQDMDEDAAKLAVVELKRLCEWHRTLFDAIGAQCHNLIENLNAYDGSGIPGSDASDGFAALRRIRSVVCMQLSIKTAPLAGWPGCTKETEAAAILENAAAPRDLKEGEKTNEHRRH